MSLPVLHLLVTVTFLYTYCAGFGANISIFASPSDVFTTSIRDLVPIYISSLFFPLFTFLVWIKGRKSPVDLALEIEDPNRRRLALTHVNRMRWLTGAFALFAFLSPMPLILRAMIEAGPIPYAFIGLMWQIPLVIIIHVFSWRFDVSGEVVHLMVIGILLIWSAAFFGLGKGQVDRHSEYLHSKISNVSCGGLAIIKNISSNYIAVDKNSSKYIVDNQCAVRFVVPPTARLRVF